MVPAPLSAVFQSLPLLPSIKLGPSSADSQVGGVLACPVCTTIFQSLGPATLPQVPSALAACLCPSYWSGLMFLLYLLVVGLPCGQIFCQFWLVFVFKLLLSFFWLCEEEQCVYLCLCLGSLLLFQFTLLEICNCIHIHTFVCQHTMCTFFI